MGSANAPQVKVKIDRAMAKHRFMQSPICNRLTRVFSIATLRIDRKTLSHVRFQQFREKADPENWFARNSFSTSKPRHSVFR